MTKQFAYGIAFLFAAVGLSACSWTFGSSIFAKFESEPDLACIENTINAMPDVRVVSSWKRSEDEALMLAPKPFAKSYSYSLQYAARDAFGGQMLVEMIGGKAAELYIWQQFPVENATSPGALTCTRDDLDYATRLMDEIYDTAKSACDLRLDERGRHRSIHKSKNCPPRESADKSEARDQSS